MKKEIPYFKIRYAFLPTWTLEEAAYLLSECDPDDSTFKISDKEGNRVSVLFYWLKTLHQSGQLFSTGFTLKEPPRFSVDQIFECMQKANREPDAELFAARQLIWGKKANPQMDNRVTKIIYQKAAELMWDKHPTLYKPKVSEHLTSLPSKLNGKYGTNLNPHQPSEIFEFIKGNSPHKKGAPKKDVDQNMAIDWNYVIENM